MTKFFLLVILLSSNAVFAQDTLVPLEFNPYLKDIDIKKSGNSTDSTFVFIYDNLELPVFDDFSINKWVKYESEYTGPNVTSVLNYYLIDGGTLQGLPASTMLCDSNKARLKTVIIVDGEVEDSVYTNFSSGISVLIDDLNDVQQVFPPPVTLYEECYTLIDTLVNGVLVGLQDTIFYAPDYTQDSARVFTADISTDDEIWEDDYACHNYRFPVEPKSLGVATLDGVSNDGYPYDFGSSNAYGIADYLTSKPINMLGKSNVYLTFLYQAKGFGNSPENVDSLKVEFYSETFDIWYPIWGTSGDVVDNTWNTAQIEISANLFLQDGFKFRFSNNATLSGQLDHWHIDYVNLRENSFDGDTIIDDLAISYPIETFLKDFTAAPWDHYNNLSNPTSVMIDDYDMLIKNNHIADKISNAGALTIDGNNFSLPITSTGNWNVGTNIYTFNVGNQPYNFPQNSSIPKGEFDVKMNIATSTTNIISENDTTYFTQRFRNYYAYDDGTAETGYGVLDNNAQIAYQFEAYEADTLTGILMKFIPNVTDVTNNIFLITVWEDSAGLPGEIIYKDDFFSPHYPKYAAGKRQYSYYKFNGNAAIPVPKKYFIGFEQIEDQNLFLGFDLNNNNQDKIFYNTGGNWGNASFPGSLIMRPVYSTGLNNTLEVQPVLPEKVAFNMYPNPVTHVLTIQDLPNSYQVKVFDLSGREVKAADSNQIDFSHLNSGFYIVNIANESGISVYSQKIIKQ
ncbi:MAG: T9SS type A sorting domain-containing protein [Crocinitomicaceae bacterium]